MKGSEHIIRLNRPQTAARRLLGPSQTVCIPWGRGVGKSFFERLVAYTLVSQFDGKRMPGSQRLGVRIVFLFDTLEHFKAVHGELMIDELEGHFAGLGGVVNRTTYAVRFPGGSWIRPFPATEYHSQKGRGIRCDAVICDEADDIDPGVYAAVAIPWFSEPWSYKLTIIGGTPRRGRYGMLYQYHCLGLDADYPNHHTVHATYLDAPETVDAEAVEEARRLMSPAVFAREWEASFDSNEGLVYDLFDQNFHCREPDEHGFDSYVIGVDWGYVDPGTFLVFGIRGRGNDAQAHLVAEYYEKGRVLSWWLRLADDLHKAYPKARWFADPSQPASIEAIRELGCDIARADNRIEQGIACVADKLYIRGQDSDSADDRWARLYLDPGAKNTIKELLSYRRKLSRESADEFVEKPEDKHNHALDAMRYAMMGHFGEPGSKRTEWAAY